VSHKGQAEGGLVGSYFVIFREGDEFVAVPAEQWVKFKPHYEMENALTLEEAESLMSNRSKAGSRITQKLKVSESARGDGQGGAKAADDSDEEDFAVGFRKAKKDANDDDDGGMGPPPSPEHGEGLDFDEVFDNDDETLVPDDEAKPEEEHKPKDMKTEEEEEAEEEELDESGKGLQQILKRHKAEWYDDEEVKEEEKPAIKTEEEDEDGEDEEEDDEDLDEMVQNVAAQRPGKAAPSQRPAQAGARAAAPPGKRKPGKDGEGAPQAKRMRVPSPTAAATGARAQVKEEGRAAQGGQRRAAEPPARSKITKEEVVAVLKGSSGKVQIKDLIRIFKGQRRLQSPDDQKHFLSVVKEVAKFEEVTENNEKVRNVVLRDKFK